MRVNIKYIASSGNEYDLISNGILHKEANYHTWGWGIDGTQLQYGFRVADFSRDAAVYKTQLIFYGGEEQRRDLIGRLHDDFEQDVRTKKPGRIIWGAYYINCYITESSTEPEEHRTWTQNDISIYAPYPFWIQDLNIELPKGDAEATGFLEFPFDFAFDFTSPVMGSRIIPSDFPFESEFKMVIYGLAVNPRVVVNDYAYVLDLTVPDGSYVVIDSRAKTIMMYGQSGAQTNVFDYRNKTDSVFQKIPAGNLNIAWDSSYGVDMTIYRERSEPRAEA